MNDPKGVRSALEIFYRETKPDTVIENIAVRYWKNPRFEQPKFVSLGYPKGEFTRIAKGHLNGYNTNQLEAMYDKIKTDARVQHRETDSPESLTRIKELGVFDLTESCAEKMLQETDDGIVCDFNWVLFWRDLSHRMTEDLFVTAYVAGRDFKFCRDRNDFSWPSVILTNNVRLKNLLRKGLADNHFHLKASSPVFDWQWIHVMNYAFSAEKERFRERFDAIEKSYLSNKTDYIYQEKRLSLFTLVYIAASIRLFIYKKLKGSAEKTDFAELLSVLKAPEFPEYADMFHDRKSGFYLDAIRFLSGYGPGELDYAMPQGPYDLLSGERWLMYSVFRQYFEQGNAAAGESIYDLFYLYLIIKIRVRDEFIQVNDRYGFDNFSKYDRRKGDMLPDDAYCTRLKYYYAVSNTLKSKSILSLEARIVPEQQVEKLANQISEIDSVILNDRPPFPSTIFEELEEEYKHKEDMNERDETAFFVYHFPKRADDDLQRLLDDYREDRVFIEVEKRCRHAKYREEIRETAEAIAMFRNVAPGLARRVYGIDACSNELICRPEVFAVAFRYLSGHVSRASVFGSRQKLPNMLKMTYHVGEDFYDIADGLRAIEEAVRFLCLGEGSRLGHALALGVDAKHWYIGRRNEIWLSTQEFIDNLAWIYSRIQKFGIPDCHSFCERIDGLFRHHYAQVYGHDKDLAGIDIHDYFESWKLRGHDPGLYISGQRNDAFRGGGDWDKYLFNTAYGEYDVPKRVQKLYYCYHYDSRAKAMGSRKISYFVEEKYISVMEKLQEKMQRFIGRKHIGLETNPSSNVLVGRLSRYDEHPIQKWYNIGLTSDNENLRTSPQSFISINTDDQGVFNTSLENEYALLACALEKQKRPDGSSVYNQAQIYEWLESIRRMGLEQCFRTPRYRD